MNWKTLVKAALLVLTILSAIATVVFAYLAVSTHDDTMGSAAGLQLVLSVVLVFVTAVTWDEL